jgi:hypothetical protein
VPYATPSYDSLGQRPHTRLYLSKEEIERICVDELHALNLLPSSPEPIRIDRFIEKRFVTPSYEELEEGILGFTQFGKSGVQAIIVNSRIDEQNTKGASRRVRTTLAHEGGHGLLHTHLFALSTKQNPLFEGGQTSPKVLCRDENDANDQKKYRGKWWEYQANRAIGSLLLPKHLTKQVVHPFLVSFGHMGMKALSEPRRGEAEAELSEAFDVNPVVARIRLEELYPRQAGQLILQKNLSNVSALIC